METQCLFCRVIDFLQQVCFPPAKQEENGFFDFLYKKRQFFSLNTWIRQSDRLKTVPEKVGVSDRKHAQCFHSSCTSLDFWYKSEPRRLQKHSAVHLISQRWWRLSSETWHTKATTLPDMSTKWRRCWILKE